VTEPDFKLSNYDRTQRMDLGILEIRAR